MKEIIRQIGSIYRSLEYISNQEFKRLGLDHNLYAYLVFIVENPNTILEQLAINVKVDKTTASRGLKKLEEKKFIRKEYVKGNKKENHLFATNHGLEVYKRILTEYEYSEKHLLSSLSTQQQRTLNELLNQVEQKADQEWTKVKNGETRDY